MQPIGVGQCRPRGVRAGQDDAAQSRRRAFGKIRCTQDTRIRRTRLLDRNIQSEQVDVGETPDAAVGGHGKIHHAVGGARNSQPALIREGRKGWKEIFRGRKDGRHGIAGGGWVLAPGCRVHENPRQFHGQAVVEVREINITLGVQCHRQGEQVWRRIDRAQGTARGGPFRDGVVVGISDVKIPRAIHGHVMRGV